ncbi:MAG: hypothetical protein AB7O38_00075 [Pirellulaceae bacterium]
MYPAVVSAASVLRERDSPCGVMPVWEEAIKEIPKVAGGLLLTCLFVAACFGVGAGVARISPEPIGVPSERTDEWDEELMEEETLGDIDPEAMSGKAPVEFE